MVAAVALKQTNKQKQLPSEPEDVMVTKYKDRFFSMYKPWQSNGTFLFQKQYTFDI